MPNQKGCRGHVISLDLSRNFFQFTLPDGELKYKTCSGGLTTIVIGTVFFAFIIEQLINVVHRKHYSV